MTLDEFKSGESSIRELQKKIVSEAERVGAKRHERVTWLIVLQTLSIARRALIRGAELQELDINAYLDSVDDDIGAIARLGEYKEAATIVIGMAAAGPSMIVLPDTPESVQ